MRAVRHDGGLRAGFLRDSRSGVQGRRVSRALVPEPNPEAMRVLRTGISELDHLCGHFEDDEDLLRRAYPYQSGRVDDYTLEFDYDDPERGDIPADFWRTDRYGIHKLMRLSFSEGMTYLVEDLEEMRQFLAAQTAFAIEDYERQRKGARRQS